MYRKQSRIISLCLSCLMIASSMPVNAEEITADPTGNSIEVIKYQESTVSDFVPETNVYAQIGSEYKVTIPKVIVLSGVSKKLLIM